MEARKICVVWMSKMSRIAVQDPSPIARLSLLDNASNTGRRVLSNVQLFCSLSRLHPCCYFSLVWVAILALRAVAWLQNSNWNCMTAEKSLPSSRAVCRTRSKRPQIEPRTLKELAVLAWAKNLVPSNDCRKAQGSTQNPPYRLLQLL